MRRFQRGAFSRLKPNDQLSVESQPMDFQSIVVEFALFTSLSLQNAKLKTPRGSAGRLPLHVLGVYIEAETGYEFVIVKGRRPINTSSSL